MRKARLSIALSGFAIAACTASPSPLAPSPANPMASAPSPSPTPTAAPASEPAWAKTVRMVPAADRTDGPVTLRPSNANSVWLVGSVPEPGGLWDERYVWTGWGGTPSRPVAVLGVYILNAMDPSVQSLDAVYDCPRLIGSLTITLASPTSVSFTSSSGVRGTFDLDSKVWTFDQPVAST